MDFDKFHKSTTIKYDSTTTPQQFVMKWHTAYTELAEANTSGKLKQCCTFHQHTHFGTTLEYHLNPINGNSHCTMHFDVRSPSS
ncbi:unnamed protein product [Penicillium camemberti]|uniref:Str. FM013 n=1 Tax=Penicillium camemberti (strain FM 013) TaxID=1429867 RepID=A0A0G4P359_PENC3|nr:unnamed protein product [Penicillium camemberti]